MKSTCFMPGNRVTGTSPPPVAAARRERREFDEKPSCRGTRSTGGRARLHAWRSGRHAWQGERSARQASTPAHTTMLSSRVRSSQLTRLSLLARFLLSSCSLPPSPLAALGLVLPRRHPTAHLRCWARDNAGHECQRQGRPGQEQQAVHNALRCRSRHHFESLSISTSAGVVEVRGPFFDGQSEVVGWAWGGFGG